MSDKKDIDCVRIEADASFVQIGDDIKAGIAAVLQDNETGKAVFAVGKSINCRDNQMAELHAILYALEEIPQSGCTVELFNDSQDAIGLINGEITCPERYFEMAQKIRNRVRQKKLTVTFVWRPRTEQSVADALSTLAARKAENEEIRAKI